MQLRTELTKLRGESHAASSGAGPSDAEGDKDATTAMHVDSAGVLHIVCRPLLGPCTAPQLRLRRVCLSASLHSCRATGRITGRHMPRTHPLPAWQRPWSSAAMPVDHLKATRSPRHQRLATDSFASMAALPQQRTPRKRSDSATHACSPPTDTDVQGTSTRCDSGRAPL